MSAARPRWWREPLLHFLLIGGLLFAVYTWRAPASGTGEAIVVTQALVDELARQHQARWLRPPTAQELAQRVDSHVRDERVYREGLALGLDRDDPVIKRRLRQKFDLLAEEQLASAPPTDAELAAHLARHPERFTQAATLSFEQLFFAGTQATAAQDRAVAGARAALARGLDPQGLGQTSLLPRRVDQQPEDQIRRDFGADFCAQLARLPLGAWSGPLQSGLGTHLVRVVSRTPARLPPLDEVRQPVARDWEDERRERSRAATYLALQERYPVRIDAVLATPHELAP